MKPYWLSLTSAGILSLALAGCGAAASPAGASQTGGTAVYALPPDTSPNWFFPEKSLQAATVVNDQTDFMLYKPLLYFSSNDQFDPAHSLAQSVTWNKAGTVYTVKLNPKWHWSNGHPVTAQDVVFTYRIMRAASLAGTHYAWSYEGQGFGGMPTEWKSVVAANQDTVVITTTEPRSPDWFVRNGIAQIIPVPASVWNKHPNNMTQELAFINSVANAPTNPVYHVVDGPYHLASYQANTNWTFVPNTHYSGHPSYLSKVVFQYETSESAEFAALKTGSVNVGYLSPELLSSRKELPNDQLSIAYPFGFDFFQLNMSPKAPNGIGKAFDTLAVRQALQYGVDQQGMIKHIFGGYGVVDDTTLAPEPKTPFFNPAMVHQPYPYNPQKGKALLEKNGWHLVNGVMTKNGIKLEFTLDYAAGSTSGTDTVELLKNDWAQEGIVVNLVQQPFDTVVSDSQANPTQWAAIDWNQGNLGGWTYGNPYPSGDGLFTSGGAENLGGYSNHTMDQLINATLQPGTTQQRLTRMYAYEAYAAQQLPSAIFLPWEPLFNVHANNVHGTVSTFNPIGDVLFPNYWWVSK